MEKICCDLTEPLAQICFAARSMERILASGSADRSMEDLEAAAGLIRRLSEEALQAMRELV